MGHASTIEISGDAGRGEGASIGLALPLRDSDLFRHGASRYVLNFLSDNPEVNVSIRQLATITPYSERSTRAAVDALEANGLLETHHEGNARRVQINRSRLSHPADPITSIPQPQFRTPVRVARQYLEDTFEEVYGLILFGSVARGTADRQSDIDLWVLVGGDHMEQRHEANKLASHLGSMHIPPTIPLADASAVDFTDNWAEIKSVLEDEEVPLEHADRYSFELLVETPRSIIAQTERIDAAAIFGEGITVLSSDTLERTTLEVLGDE